MGLDISAYETAKLTPEHEQTDTCWDDDHRPAALETPDFAQSFRGLEHGRCYEVGGEGTGFRAGPYSYYNRFREALCRAALGVETNEVWADPDRYRERPFFEILNFTDCDGEVGPEACADLAGDFRTSRDHVRPILVDVGGEEYGSLYDDFARAFDIAAGGGMVVFH